MKTKKSYTKRLKTTKTGKVLARKAGHNHFNAKASRGKQLHAKKSVEFHMSNKSKSRYLINVN